MRTENTVTVWEVTEQDTDRSGTTVLARLGLLGPLAFMTVALLLPAASEYSLIGDTISELAIGRFGLVACQ